MGKSPRAAGGPGEERRGRGARPARVPLLSPSPPQPSPPGPARPSSAASSGPAAAMSGPGGRAALALLLLLGLPGLPHARPRYEPTWGSLDARPLPAWFDEAKFGVFIHWGVFSVPSFGSEWFWWYWQKEKREPYVKFMDANYPPGFSYEDFGPLFTAEFFDPNQWADILKASGAKYVVLTSKHHEGFTLWGSKYSWNWNAVDVGPKRDLVAELATSVKNRTDLHFGLYHSLFEWFNPLFLEDATNAFNTSKFPTSKSLPELYEIVTKYQPEIIWSDGDGNAPDTYWNSTGFLAWLYNDSPVRDTVVTNDRWGAGSICAHGGFYTCSDRYNPGRLLPRKWENCMTIDRGSWGYRRDARLRDYLPIEDLVKQLVETVSCGGNLLMNIGPTHDGRIAVVFEERLRQVGSWLQVNGEAIYGTKPWRAQNDTVTPGVWYTFTPKEGKVNAIFLNWPVSGILELGEPRAKAGETQVKLAGYRELLKWVALGEKGMVIALPQLTPQQMPCQWGWTLQLTDVD
ncbi:LOW QUALITY PROTEIN: plasma alpha-L-fucosidase [Ammospiza caudacuta]|uniref:LOW QUALITY PROTEIN: plasma alpha-L-fucosidase n=1 Tax=Ammospiza caudacuta TaxID=2857398 RepID=UPI00273A4142|nr:LOW QUALITY PROTEIN: plasma alpha-L-fucosidase [Ammospiza caudacuta]